MISGQIGALYGAPEEVATIRVSFLKVLKCTDVGTLQMPPCFGVFVRPAGAQPVDTRSLV
jgi:hypothetical protein